MTTAQTALATCVQAALPPPDPTCTIVARPNPLDCDTVYCETRAGQTIAEMLGDAVSQACEVQVGGYPVPRELWGRLRPKAGAMLHVTIYPQGGGNGTKWIRMVALVTIAIMAPYLSGYIMTGTWATAGASYALTAGIMIGGSLLVNALVPPPTPKMGGANGDPFQQLSAITGTSNQVNPYGVIPCVVGTYRYFPPHAAQPYTEILGNDQYVRMLLDLGHGDLDVSDIQIGDTAISEYDGVQYEITTTPTLFTQDMAEVGVGVPLETTGANATRTTQAGSTEISVDLVAQSGIFGLNKKGTPIYGYVSFTVAYRPTGSNAAWTLVTRGAGVTVAGLSGTGSTFTVAGSQQKTLRTGLRWTVPAGQYDVMVTRTGESFPDAATEQAKSKSVAWTVLRSIRPQLPSTTGTLKLALRIKASDQLNGSLPQVSVLAAQKVGSWNKTGQNWDPIAETQNPAWIYAWLLTRCPAVARRLPDSRVDLNGIADWADECDAKGYKVSFVMDSARAFGDILRDVLACGRASFGMRNGRYSAVRDVPQAVPVQMFTPANSWGFSYSRSFAKLPHALRCKFVNPAAGYKQDYVTVYAPGYNADGSGGMVAATLFEELDLGPVVDPDAAWRLGKYHLAVGYRRATTYVLNADIEHMVCERGDLVRVAHDVTAWGQAWGRVVAVSNDGLTITLDGPVDLAAGTTYQLQVRKADGTQARVNVTTGAGENLRELVTASATGAQPGDLWTLGEVNHGTADLLVKAVEPGDDLTAQLTLVDAAPDVWTADAGTPPPFVSDITNAAWCEAPPPPQLQLVVSPARATSGALTPGVGVDLPPTSGIHRTPPDRFGGVNTVSVIR